VLKGAWLALLFFRIFYNLYNEELKGGC
jgi:hypothetical protein